MERADLRSSAQRNALRAPERASAPHPHPTRWHCRAPTHQAGRPSLCGCRVPTLRRSAPAPLPRRRAARKGAPLAPAAAALRTRPSPRASRAEMLPGGAGGRCGPAQLTRAAARLLSPQTGLSPASACLPGRFASRGPQKAGGRGRGLLRARQSAIDPQRGGGSRAPGRAKAAAQRRSLPRRRPRRSPPPAEAAPARQRRGRLPSARRERTRGRQRRPPPPPPPPRSEEGLHANATRGCEGDGRGA